VSSGAIASNTVLAAGGRENVVAGGMATGTLVSNGGAELVSSGGTASGTTVLSGGQEVVYQGGSATVTSGAGTYSVAGHLELGSGVQGAVSFTGSSGTLVLDAAASFSGTIAGLSASVPNDVVDLKDISVSGIASSYVGNTSSGVLTISGGLSNYPWDGRDMDELITAADHELMFKAKKEGKNSILLVGGEEGTAGEK